MTGATGAGVEAGAGAGTGVEVQGSAEGVARFALHFRLISISAALVVALFVIAVARGAGC